MPTLEFTTKDDLSRAYPFGMLAVPPEWLARVHSSPGTTGRPTLVGHTRADLDRWAERVNGRREVRRRVGMPAGLSGTFWRRRAASGPDALAELGPRGRAQGASCRRGRIRRVAGKRRRLPARAARLPSHWP
jgi:hypothetical protein